MWTHKKKVQLTEEFYGIWLYIEYFWFILLPLFSQFKGKPKIHSSLSESTEYRMRSVMNPCNVLWVIPCFSLMAMQYVFDLLLIFYIARPRKSIIKNSLQSSLSVVGFLLYLLLHIHEIHLHLLLLSVHFKYQTRLSTNFGFCI